MTHKNTLNKTLCKYAENHVIAFVKVFLLNLIITFSRKNTKMKLGSGLLVCYPANEKQNCRDRLLISNWSRYLVSFHTNKWVIASVIQVNKCAIAHVIHYERVQNSSHTITRVVIAYPILPDIDCIVWNCWFKKDCVCSLRKKTSPFMETPTNQN